MHRTPRGSAGFYGVLPGSTGFGSQVLPGSLGSRSIGHDQVSNMRRLLFAVIGVALVPLTGCASHSTPPAFQMWQLEGAVATVDASSIRVRHKSGQVVEILID